MIVICMLLLSSLYYISVAIRPSLIFTRGVKAQAGLSNYISVSLFGSDLQTN